MNEPLAAKCNDCLSGPRGIAGHDGLLAVQREDNARAIAFRCQTCNAVWTRSYEGAGVFIWTLLSRSPATQP